MLCLLVSLVIGQKSESQNGGNNKTKHVKFSRVRVRIKGKICSFFGKFGVLCFLVTFVLRFALFLYYRRNLKMHDTPLSPKMIEKVITDIDFIRASGPFCIPVVVLKNYEPEFHKY